jgi:hypothetical protein
VQALVDRLSVSLTHASTLLNPVRALCMICHEIDKKEHFSIKYLFGRVGCFLDMFKDTEMTGASLGFNLLLLMADGGREKLLCLSSLSDALQASMNVSSLPKPWRISWIKAFFSYKVLTSFILLSEVGDAMSYVKSILDFAIRMHLYLTSSKKLFMATLFCSSAL